VTRFATIALSNYAPKPVEWLWPGRIPFGCITIVDGDPATNKSSLLYDIAARVTTGRSMHDSPLGCPRGSVILVQAEDFLGTARQNLEAGGADLGNVFVFDKSSVPKLPDDMGAIAAEVEQRNAKLLVVDPISAVFSGSVNSEQAVRATTTPLAALAERTGTAIVLHLSARVGLACSLRYTPESQEIGFWR
jgi:putative DNA primase/helicase